MPITSQDVARLAGVSQPSVSRALRDVPGVSAATRKRVRDAAKALGYVPFHSGWTLATRTTGRVAIVADELSNPFYPALVAPLHDALGDAGFRTLLVTDSGSKPAELEPLLDGSLDGVLLASSRTGSTVPLALARRGVPFVRVNRELDGVQADRCVAANRDGARRVAAHLTGLGHVRVGAVFGPRSASTARQRESGFRAGLLARRIPLPATRVQRCEFDFDAGREAFLRILDQENAPTAVFCANDVLALAALDAAHAAGVSVPGDVSVVGFDDIPMAAWHVFSLTTVHIDLRRLAVSAAALLLKRMDAPDARPQRVEIPASLSVRLTTAPVASAADDHPAWRRSTRPRQASGV